jgi:hypothetical protein
MYSHSREAGFIQLWWIQRMISVTLTVVGVDKKQQRARPVVL